MVMDWGQGENRVRKELHLGIPELGFGREIFIHIYIMWKVRGRVL